MTACTCDFQDRCGGLGVLFCDGCGGDLCICSCGGECDCYGCDDCDGQEPVEWDWDDYFGEPPGPWDEP